MAAVHWCWNVFEQRKKLIGSVTEGVKSFKVIPVLDVLFD